MFLILVYQFGHPDYVPKLMKNTLEKISLIQILGNKIFIAVVSQTVSNYI